MDKRKAKKVTVLLYIMVVIFCFLIGTAFSSVYRRVPAMRIRYQAEAMQAKDAAEGKIPGNNQQTEVRKDVLDDFVYEALYKPIKSINTNWKHHVDGSLQAERRRVIDEKYNSEK